jgi:hypothetical protein
MFYVLFVCKCVLPPGVNPIAVDKYINIISIYIFGDSGVVTYIRQPAMNTLIDIFTTFCECIKNISDDSSKLVHLWHAVRTAWPVLPSE